MNLRKTIEFLVIIGHVAASQENIKGGDIVQSYDTVFGANLRNTMQSKFTLAEVNRQSVEQAQSSIKSTILGCTDYESGDALAFRLRSENKINVEPFYVDQEKDIMCFVAFSMLCDHLEEVLKQMSFYLYLPPTLKMHESLYEMIENERSTDKMEFVINVHQSLSTDQEALVDKFRKKNDMAQKYIFSDYEEFFWTSDATAKYYDTAPEDVKAQEAFQRDVARHTEWMSLAKHLKMAHMDDVNRDICGFDLITQDSVQFQTGKIVLPLQQFAAMEDTGLRAACLQFLSVMYAQDPDVTHMAVTTTTQLLNFRARSIMQSGAVGSSTDMSKQPYTNAGLDGRGQIIQVADTGVDKNSCYFYDSTGSVPPTAIAQPFWDYSYRKIIQYSYGFMGDTGDEAGGHGTHVAGTAMGQVQGQSVTTPAGQYDGMAPAAWLVMADLGKPGTGLGIPSVNELYGGGYKAGARIFSNSWGNYKAGLSYYCTNDVDAYLYNHMDVAIFFAAGNEGGNGDGYATVTMQGSGKNAITIGSSETTLGTPNITYIAWYSSKGPTYDFRFKPDIVAPGDSLMSAKSNGYSGTSCNTISMTGTSMATPAAAGNALLVRQYFMDTTTRFWRGVCSSTHNNCKSFTPSGVLIKALYIHSTSPMTLYNGGGSYDVKLGAPPDMMQGYGRLNMWNVLPLPNVNRRFNLFVDDLRTINSNSAINYAVPITTSSTPLIATLSWYDPPSTYGQTTKALLQNLDLVLISPSNQRFYPNSRTSPDTINTNEKIQVNNPQTGTWKITVSSQSLPYSGNQRFSLVITSSAVVKYA